MLEVYSLTIHRLSKLTIKICDASIFQLDWITSMKAHYQRPVMSINVMKGVNKFMAAWDQPFEKDNFPKAPLSKGSSGHINLAGNSTAPAAIFTPNHPQFLESLEPGVRELVLCLVYQHGCVTYSSCEGHSAQSEDKLVATRHVDILPRGEAERDRIFKILSSAISSLENLELIVDVQIIDGNLQSEEGPIPCLSLEFSSCAELASEYFIQVEPITAALVRLLNPTDDISAE